MAFYDISNQAKPVSSLIKRAAICVVPGASVQEAATLMSEQAVSCLLLLQDHQLVGIVTDRDIRNKAVAPGLDYNTPVHHIASLSPVTVDAQATVFESLLVLTKHNIHHLPVVQGQQVLGVITATSLMQTHSASPAAIAHDISSQHDLTGLIQATAKTQELQHSLASANASAHSIGHIMTAITDALTTRLIELAQAQLGPAPVPFAWVAAGSQGRSEQTARTDQDNCLVLDNSYDPAQHGTYFAALATFVCDGLHACGYVYCPGDMMATNTTWRVTLAQWQAYFARWIEQPDPDALMLTCVFFDLRCVAGQSALLNALRSDFLAKAQANGIFQTFMVGNALSHKPALNWLGNLDWNAAKEHPASIDLKHNAIVPLVDLARVYALAQGASGVNTLDRLNQATQEMAVSQVNQASAHDLRDTLAYLAKLRIQHQARQTANSITPDNYLRAHEVSNFEKNRLKHAFKTIAALQKAIGRRHGAQQLS
jgi:CBS domain-containing protein